MAPLLCLASLLFLQGGYVETLSLNMEEYSPYYSVSPELPSWVKKNAVTDIVLFILCFVTIITNCQAQPQAKMGPEANIHLKVSM